MPQPSTWSNFPTGAQSAGVYFLQGGVWRVGVWEREGKSHNSLCLQGRALPGLPAAVREVLVAEWVSVVSMGLLVRKSGFTCLLCHLTKFTYSSYSLVISFLICWIEVIKIAAFLGYWEDQIKLLEEKIFVNGKILFDLKPLKGFLWNIYVHIHTHTYMQGYSSFLPPMDLEVKQLILKLNSSPFLTM